MRFYYTFYYKWSQIPVITILSVAFGFTQNKRKNNGQSFEKELIYTFDEHYDFSPESNTFPAVIDLVTNIKTKKYDNPNSFGVFIDLKNAIDKMNHELLSRKLRIFGLEKLLSIQLNRTTFVYNSLSKLAKPRIHLNQLLLEFHRDPFRSLYSF